MTVIARNTCGLTLDEVVGQCDGVGELTLTIKTYAVTWLFAKPMNETNISRLVGYFEALESNGTVVTEATGNNLPTR